MGIRLSDLPPELRRRVLAETGTAPAARRPRTAAPQRHLERLCACGFEMFRPDGQYPDDCDGCGAPWPVRP